MEPKQKPIPEELNPKSTFVMGADIARTGSDETAFVVLEKLAHSDDIFVRYIETLKTPDLVQAIARAEYLDTVFRCKKIIIDITGLGAGVGDILKSRLGNKVEGIWYTNKSKNEIFTNLKLLMARNKGKLYIPDYENTTDPRVKKMFYQFLSIVQESTANEMGIKIKHQEGEHDDIINALALAASYFNVRQTRRKTYALGSGKGFQ